MTKILRVYSLTAADAADLLGVTTARVRQLARQLGGINVGREWRFRPADVRQFELPPRGGPRR